MQGSQKAKKGLGAVPNSAESQQVAIILTNTHIGLQKSFVREKETQLWIAMYR